MDELLFEFEEEAIGRAIGLRSELLHQMRNSGLAQKSIHWKIIGGRVWHTMDGAEMLLAQCGLSFPRKKKKGESRPTLEEVLRPAGQAVGDVPRYAKRVLVTSVQVMSRRSVTGFVVDTGEGVRVMVADNRNLIPGMEIVVVKVQIVGDPDLYEMVGPMPRSRGRW